MKPVKDALGQYFFTRMPTFGDLGKSSLAHSLEHVAESRIYRVDSPGRVNKIVADH